jgi:uroporphyrinogen-III synthase
VSDDRAVLLTRSAAGNRAWQAEFLKQSIPTYLFDCISFESLAHVPAVDRVLRELSQFDWIVCASAQAVKELASRVDTSRLPSLAAVGAETARTAEAYGFQVGFIPEQAHGLALAEELPEPAGKRLLLVRPEASNPVLVRRLRQRGAIVTEVTLYRTISRETAAPDVELILATGGVSAVVFASPSAVTGFRRVLNTAALKHAQRLPVVASGSLTGRALAKSGFMLCYRAREPTATGAIETLRTIPHAIP